jgi:hypothetical protein
MAILSIPFYEVSRFGRQFLANRFGGRNFTKISSSCLINKAIKSE